MRPIRLTLIATLPFMLAAKPPATNVEQALIAREKQSWAAWQDKDVAFWQRHLSADHVEIDSPQGPQSRDYVLSGVARRACTVPTYSLDDFQFRPLGDDAGMLVYRATQEFLCGDRHIPNMGWVTSIYRRHDGRWENVLFEHMLVPTPKPAAQPKPGSAPKP
jgi:hypothetical protein